MGGDAGGRMIDRPIQPDQIRIAPPRDGELHGHQVRFDHSLVNVTEDWSKVRSPGRARRRRRHGHPQRIVRISTPRDEVFRYEGPYGPLLVMHPAVWPRVARAMEVENDFFDRACRAGLSPVIARKVRSAWLELGRNDREILFRTGALQIRLQDRPEMTLAPGPVPENLTERIELLTSMALSNGGVAVVWKRLVIDEVGP
jgi:hypothetical protein